MSRRRHWIRIAVVAGLLAIGLQQLWRHGRDYVIAENFAVVEPGKLYRGAWQKPWPMKRLVHDYKIKTVLALAHTPDSPLVAEEQQLARELGIRWIHIPIIDNREEIDGKTLSQALEQAANVLADPKNQPVYFHCHHGVNRASMVQMAYRILHCGWTLDQAHDEIARNFGLVAVNHGPDYRHMKSFYERRVLHRRVARAAKSAATSDAPMSEPH